MKFSNNLREDFLSQRLTSTNDFTIQWKRHVLVIGRFSFMYRFLHNLHVGLSILRDKGWCSADGSVWHSNCRPFLISFVVVKTLYYFFMFFCKFWWIAFLFIEVGYLWSRMKWFLYTFLSGIFILPNNSMICDILWYFCGTKTITDIILIILLYEWLPIRKSWLIFYESNVMFT